MQVDIETGEIVLVGSLDYEVDASYRFTVNVTDNGEVPNSNFTEVHKDQNGLTLHDLCCSHQVLVTVGDVNDNHPVFQNTSYSTTIAEANTVSSYVILTVSDLFLRLCPTDLP